MEEGNAEAAILAWLQSKIDEMSDRELAKFRGDLLLNHLLDIYDFLEKLEKRDRATGNASPTRGPSQAVGVGKRDRAMVIGCDQAS